MENETRIPAEGFTIGSFIQEELDARGWTTTDLAARMPGDAGLNTLAVDMLIAVDDKNLMLGDETAEGLSAAFGTSKEYWINLERACRGVS